MSSAEHIWNLYDKIRDEFFRSSVETPTGKYPIVTIDGKEITSEFLDALLQSCVELYNQIDSSVEVLKLTVPEVYEELKELISTKIIGKAFEKCEFVVFRQPEYSYYEGEVEVNPVSRLPLGIKNIIDLLSKAFENREAKWIVLSDQFYYTAKASFRALRASLTYLLTRFDYVMMYPHRIVIDRIVLEAGLRKHGMDRVVGYIESAEEYFNQQKYVEFCAISRNALHDAIKNICFIIDGVEHGFSNNCNRLKELGFFKNTTLKQMKEFSGGLSACGSHPPEEELSNEEAKFLLDSLYGFLGLTVLSLSSFKKTKSKTSKPN